MSVKITDLPTVGTVANDDWMEIVDISDPSASAEGTSKKVSVGAIRGPTPTYALTDLTDTAINTPEDNGPLMWDGNVWVDGPPLGVLAFLDKIGTSEITDLSVITPKIAGGAVTWNKLADAAVTTPKIANNVTLTDPVLKSYRQTGQTPSIDTGVVTIPYGDGNAVKITVDEDLTDIQISGWPAGVYAKIDICLQVDATGGHTIDLSSVVGGWPGGAAPVLEGTANARHRLVVVRDADGQVDWTLAGQAYA